MELVQISPLRTAPAPKPEWLKARAPVGENYHDLKRLARSLGLHTVCESAHCPNIGECWHHKTATFMMLGNLCTRRCGFCAVPKGRPEPIDFDEPRRVAEAIATLGLEHAVITSVNRDDDLVGGARAFAMVIEEIRRQAPGCRVEVLIPDFQGREEAIRIVVDARPEVLNHNTESVPRLYRVVRSGARYERTLRLLQFAKELNPAGVTKSGVMVGLGEETSELLQVFRDLAATGCDILTIGQYLRPSRDHLPMARLYTPREFAELKSEADEDGFPPRRIRPVGPLQLPRPRAGRVGNLVAEPSSRHLTEPPRPNHPSTGEPAPRSLSSRSEVRARKRVEPKPRHRSCFPHGFTWSVKPLPAWGIGTRPDKARFCFREQTRFLREALPRQCGRPHRPPPGQCR